MHFVGHKISLIVLALVVLIMPACLTDKEEVEVYVGEGYYRAIILILMVLLVIHLSHTYNRLVRITYVMRVLLEILF